jgi:hypothetical protein
MSELVFIDCEASGLHSTSYPIEVGWATLDLSCEGFLIRPHSSWSEWDWSLESEKIHGIRRVECIMSGIDVREAAERLNREWGGRVVISDAPGFDGPWIARLFDAAGVDPAFPVRLVPGMAAIRDEIDARRKDLMAIEQRLSRVIPRPHRAAADAKYLAALWRCAHEEGFLERLESGAL